MNILRRIGCTLVIFSAAIAFTRAADRPNIVFVITDDQGYGDLGYTGNPIVKTPHLDRLAAESSQLTDYHVAPTCSPTRAALLTGERKGFRCGGVRDRDAGQRAVSWLCFDLRL